MYVRLFYSQLFIFSNQLFPKSHFVVSCFPEVPDYGFFVVVQFFIEPSRYFEFLRSGGVNNQDSMAVNHISCVSGLLR